MSIAILACILSVALADDVDAERERRVQVFRSQETLELLKELTTTSVAGSRLTVTQTSALGPRCAPQSMEVVVDGRVVYAWSSEPDSSSSPGALVFSGVVPPGEHRLELLAVTHRQGVFRTHTQTVRLVRELRTEEGHLTEVGIVLSEERGGMRAARAQISADVAHQRLGEASE